VTLALAGLALCAPGAYAQESDVARGTATRIVGDDPMTAETTTYVIEAVSGPLGENAAGLITRTFTGPSGNSVIVADVTCLAVAGNRAAVIGRVRPDETVGIGAEAVLIRIYDGTLELQPDAASTAVDPRVAGEITFTGCAEFLPPAPFPTQPITAGDFQVIDTEPPPPPPPPPPDCDDDDGGDGLTTDDDCDD
jgi:hypothetical protein